MLELVLRTERYGGKWIWVECTAFTTSTSSLKTTTAMVCACLPLCVRFNITLYNTESIHVWNQVYNYEIY